MIEFIKEQRQKFPKLCEIFRFLIVGGLATIIDMLVMAFIIFIPNKQLFNNDFFQVFLSNKQPSEWLVVIGTAIGFIVGLIFNYIFSILYVYDSDNAYAKTKKGFVVFAILSTIGLFIQTLGMFIGYSLIGINEWIVKITLVFVVLIFNYITRKVFIFNKKDKSLSQSLDKEHNQTTDALTQTNINNSDPLSKLSIIINLGFILSSICLCYLMYNPNIFGASFKYTRYLKHLYALATLLITSFYLFIINKNILKKIDLKNKPITLIFTSIYTIGIISTLLDNTALSMKKGIIIAVGSCFAVFCYSYLLITFATKLFKSFWNSLDKFNKKIFISISITGILITSGLFLITKIFTHPHTYDIFLSFDSGFLLNNNFDTNQLFTENDFRHLLMSFCIMPFAIIPHIVYSLFHFIPAFDGLLISFVQVILIAYCIITLISILKIEDKKSAIIITLLLMVSAGTLYNMITAEKFVFGLFYIITTIDFTLKKSPLKWIFFIGAIGILTTNIFLLPIVLFYDKKPFKDWLSELIVIGVIFVFVLLITGQFNLLLFCKKSWENLKRFASVDKNISILNNIIQYLTFVGNIILTPEVVYSHAIRQATPSTNFMTALGFTVLIINLLGFIFNYKNKFAQICFYWQIFMAFLLVGIGWGVTNNEMFIYSALFTWSTITLVYMFIDKLIQHKKTKIIIFSILIGAIFIYNSIQIIPILDFAKTNYPGILI